MYTPFYGLFQYTKQKMARHRVMHFWAFYAYSNKKIAIRQLLHPSNMYCLNFAHLAKKPTASTHREDYRTFIFSTNRWCSKSRISRMNLSYIFSRYSKSDVSKRAYDKSLPNSASNFFNSVSTKVLLS